jgi:hypothetical protein
VNDVCLTVCLQALAALANTKQYINGELTKRYNLDISTKEKPAMNVDDLYLVQHHNFGPDTSVFADERQRIQLGFVNLISSYTGTRPGAVVYVNRNVNVLGQCAISGEESEVEVIELDMKELECLYYKHITLVLLPNPAGVRDILAMEVDLRFTKGYKRTFKRQVNPLTTVSLFLTDI